MVERRSGRPSLRYLRTATPNPHGYALIYLHGVHLNRLIDKPAFTAEFERHGLRVIAPMTGRSWWTDRICPEFDPNIDGRAARARQRRAVHWRTTWNRLPPRIGLLGTSMGGQGALRLAFKHPNTFPVVAAISPAIDYQLRWNEGDETLQRMYSDPEAARQDTATLHVHPLNWPRNILVLLRPDRSSLARKRRSAANEARRAGNSARIRPGNQRRRPRLRVLQPHGAQGDWRSLPSGWSANGCE